MSNCPHCESPDTECKDSRHVSYEGQPAIRRRRSCKACNFRFSTFELTAEYLNVIRPKGVNQVNKFKDLMRQIYITMEKEAI